MGKMAQYRKAKQLIRARELAAEQGCNLELALAVVEAREKEAMQALEKMANGSRKAKRAAKKTAKPKLPDTPHERFCQKVRNGYVPYEGGAPGLGKGA